MKKIVMFFAALLILASLFSPGVTAQEFKAEAGKTILNWEGKGVGKAHTGAISLKSGSVVLNEGVPVEGEFIFDMNSLTNTDLAGNMAGRLIGHLKSDDFFSVETYPEVTFSLLDAEKLADGKISINGKLTIKGKTNPIQFISDATIIGKDYRFMGRAEVDRSLFDVRYGSGSFFENLGDKTINDIFTLDFDLYVIPVK